MGRVRELGGARGVKIGGWCRQLGMEGARKNGEWAVGGAGVGLRRVSGGGVRGG